MLPSRIYSLLPKRLVLAWVAFAMLGGSACTAPVSPGEDREASPTVQTTGRATSSAALNPANVTPTSSSASSAAPALQATAVRGQIVRFWHPWTGPTGQVMQALVEEFNLSNEWRITVSTQALAGLDEMNARLSETLATDSQPDLAVGYLHQALNWDAVLPLVDWEAYVQDRQVGWTQQEQAGFYPVFWEQDFYSGRRLGIPAQRFGMVLYYNRSWAQELGFASPPDTPLAFRTQACAAARVNRLDERRDNDGTGGWLVDTSYVAMLSWLYAFGAQVTAPESQAGESAYRLDAPEVEAAFTFLKDLYDVGCAWQAESALSEDEFAGRLGLFAAGSVAGIQPQAQVFQQRGSLDEWTILPFPSQVGKPAFAVYGPSYLLFPSFPERQLAAWLFIRWLHQPENQARLVQAAGSFPLSRATLGQLSSYRASYPQWGAAVELIPLGRGEPPYRSWDLVRWSLSDAGSQLFRSYFTLAQLPDLLSYLAYTADELHLSLENWPALGETPPAATLAP